ncbi:uncharacterized protein [Macrobrachium rosenbergii]|uniref:uncharacterized protein n=1 Tax=Macrobrachium rosenbergii TaxID=79674 RepID=UPI0034D6C7FA
MGNSSGKEDKIILPRLPATKSSLRGHSNLFPLPLPPSPSPSTRSLTHSLTHTLGQSSFFVSPLPTPSSIISLPPPQPLSANISPSSFISFSLCHPPSSPTTIFPYLLPPHTSLPSSSSSSPPPFLTVPPTPTTIFSNLLPPHISLPILLPSYLSHCAPYSYYNILLPSPSTYFPPPPSPPFLTAPLPLLQYSPTFSLHVFPTPTQVNFPQSLSFIPSTLPINFPQPTFTNLAYPNPLSPLPPSPILTTQCS